MVVYKYPGYEKGQGWTLKDLLNHPLLRKPYDALIKLLFKRQSREGRPHRNIFQKEYLGLSWARFGPSWARLGQSWGCFEVLGGPSWAVLAVLGPSWGRLGRSWAVLGRPGPVFDRLGPSWGRIELILG